MTTTQNCTECGTVAEPGQSFCDACGGVLSWTGNRDTPAAASNSTTPPPGWDAFTRRDGGTGLPPRDTRTPAAATATATAPPDDQEEATPTAPLQSGNREEAATTGPLQGDGAVSATATTAPRQGHGDSSGTATTAPLQGRGDREETATTAPLQGRGDREETATTAPLQGDGAVSATATTAPLQGRGELRDQPRTTRTDSTTPDAPTVPTPQAPPAVGEVDDAHDRARRLLIPVRDTEPAPTPATVSPVLPGRPTPQRPTSVRAPGEDLGAHGGTPCPWCATPNRPDRHFCTRCAMPMAGHPDASPSAPRPWWRRILDFRNRETPWAGDRPRLRRTFDRVLTWIGVALLLTVVAVLAVNTPKAISATRDHFAKRVQVPPDRVSASRSYAGHKPDLAFDKLNNTWWGPGVAQSGQGEWIEARFDEPTRLLNVIFTSGESTHFDQLKKSALPHRLKATIKTADGKTEDRELVLDQTAGGQTRGFRAADVVSVRFTIESSYQASAETQVAIAEIEFFGPSSAGSS
ncbi:zinc ribbon domain-containing protein [Streptomyces sp. NPDC006654]|uniref:zinc ribbon domain-containing protein n=1 Tax=Streptomyces sp. NPDC006654 TaxID=3156897 RepID=UPI0033BFBC8A